MNIPIAIMIVYVILLYMVAWYSTKLAGKGGALGYFLASRGFPASVVAVMISGLAIGGASTVGVAQNAYTQGLSAGMYNAGWAIGAALVGLVAANRFRNLNISTLPDLFERFYTKSGRVIGVVCQLVILLTIVSLQYVAGGAVLAALLPDYFTFNSGMVVTAIAFVGVCLIGGYWAAGLSNLINVIVIYLGLVIGAVVVVSSAGGFEGMNRSLPEPHWFSWIEGVGLVGVASWIVVMITQAFGAQAAAQISFAAKDGHTARKGYFFGALLILPIGFVSALFGMAAAAKFPGLEHSAMALPTVLLEQHPAISGLTLAGLWAADVSTAVGLLLSGAMMLMNNILKPVLKPDWTQKQEIKYSRYLVLAVAAVTFLMALQVRSILGTIMIGLSLTTAFTLIFMATLFFPGLCRKSSAVWTLVVGLVFIFIEAIDPGFKKQLGFSHIIYVEWLACLITFLLVAVFDKNKCRIPPGYAKKPLEEETAAA